MFEALTVAERDRLIAKLNSGATRAREEYSALCSMGERSAALLAEGYQFPAAGPRAWLQTCLDAIITAAEVSGVTLSPSAHWSR